MATPILVNSDTAPLLTATLTDDSTSGALDLTDAVAVYLQVRRSDDRRFLINSECTITSAVAGAVEYQLQAGDLDFDGECSVRFLVIWSDGTRQHTVPAIDMTVEPQ